MDVVYVLQPKGAVKNKYWSLTSVKCSDAFGCLIVKIIDKHEKLTFTGI